MINNASIHQRSMDRLISIAVQQLLLMSHELFLWLHELLFEPALLGLSQQHDSGQKQG